MPALSVKCYLKFSCYLAKRVVTSADLRSFTTSEDLKKQLTTTAKKASSQEANINKTTSTRPRRIKSINRLVVIRIP